MELRAEFQDIIADGISETKAQSVGEPGAQKVTVNKLQLPGPVLVRFLLPIWHIGRPIPAPICAHVCLHMYIRICICTHLYAYVYVYMYMILCIYAYTNTTLCA